MEPSTPGLATPAPSAYVSFVHLSFQPPQIWPHVQAHVVANFNNLDIKLPKFDLQTQRDEAFYAKFPFGKVRTLIIGLFSCPKSKVCLDCLVSDILQVPALETADGVYLVESSAIAFYLASSGPKANQLLGADLATKARIQQWIFHFETEIIVNLIPFIQISFGRREKNAKAEAAWSAGFERSLAYVNKHLEANKWLAGTEEISLADITVASGLLKGLDVYFKGGESEFAEKYAEIGKWYERVKAVPEVKAAIDANGIKE